MKGEVETVVMADEPAPSRGMLRFLGFAENGWRASHYQCVRAAFGLYLFIHFAMLLPWAPELFSAEGMLPDASSSPVAAALPEWVMAWDQPLMTKAMLGFAMLASAALALGRADRFAALGIWAVLALTFARNPLIANPSLPFVGWLLLVHACLPRVPAASLVMASRAAVGEESVRRMAGREAASAGPVKEWRFPAPFYAAVWVLMSVGYSYSGLAKLGSASWVDGSAMRFVLENPLARPGALRDGLLAMPDGLLAAATYGALALECGFVFLALSSRLRPWIWVAMTGMHLGLIGLIDFADLSVGMLMVQAFAFDPAWWSRLRRAMLDRPADRRTGEEVRCSKSSILKTPDPIG